MTQIFENPVKQPLLPSSWLIQKDATASYYEVPADGLEEIILVLKALESRLVWLFCTEPATEGSRLWYVFERGEDKFFNLWSVGAVDISQADRKQELLQITFNSADRR